MSVSRALVGAAAFMRCHRSASAARARASGSPLIIQEYIYRGGTFALHGNTTGVDEDGSAQFPEWVIGPLGWGLQH